MNKGGFSVTEIKDGKICVVTFGETLDSRFDAGFTEMISLRIEEGQRFFLFDFRYTQIVQSPAVASILESANLIAESKKRVLSCCNMSEMLENIFEMVGLFMFSSHFNDEHLAIEGFGDYE